MSVDDDPGDPLADLSYEKKQAIAELAEARVDDELSRREMMKMIGVLGSGAVIGGGASAAAMEATGKARGGTSESGTVGTAANPVDAHIEDLSGPSGPITLQNALDANSQNINNVNSLDTEELSHTQPTGTYDWQSLLFILGQGDVVTTDGKVFQGSSPLSDAISDLGGNGAIYAGNGTYGPLSPGVNADNLTIIGIGQRTKIKGGTSGHGIDITSNGIFRFRLMNCKVSTTAGQGNNFDALHIENDGSTNSNVGEMMFSDVTFEQADRNCVRLVGATGGAVERIRFSGCEFADADEEQLHTNQHTQDTEATGNFLTTSDTTLVSLDGDRESVFGTFSKDITGNQPELEFRANSQDCFVSGAGIVKTTTPTNNGTNNSWYGSDWDATRDGQLGALTYGPLSISSSDEGIVGRNPGPSGGTSGGSGTVVDGGTSDHAVTIADGFRQMVTMLSAKTTAGQGNNFDAIHITKDDAHFVTNCYVSESDRHGLMIESTANKAALLGNIFASNSIDGDDIHIDGDDNVAINAHRGGTVVIDGDNNFVIALGATITDNGAGNTTHS